MLELGDKKSTGSISNFRYDPDPDLTSEKGPSIRSRSSKKDRDLDLSIVDRKILMH